MSAAPARILLGLFDQFALQGGDRGGEYDLKTAVRGGGWGWGLLIGLSAVLFDLLEEYYCVKKRYANFID